jgi:hypothetical protein
MKTFNMEMFFHVQSRAATKATWETIQAFPSYDAAMDFAKSLDQDGLEPDNKTVRILPVAK